ncbi:hypothetical protein, partial [Pseudomonas brassicacearum]|uniref:Orn/Lys/Arg family decarboxylase n=1 Tax=Pseudomonas brassicacearum TaxID=930166 RepID=UPI0011CECA46
ADDIFAAMKQHKTSVSVAQSFVMLPQAVCSPVQDYEKLVRNHIEKVTLDNDAGRISATGIVPYPPGIP